MNELQLIEWFDRAPLPSILPDPVIVLGGTSALPAFADAVVRSGQGGTISIASAFSDATLRAELPALAELQHRSLDLIVVTSTPNDAARVTVALRQFEWRSFLVKSLRGLHAKLYAFEGDRGASACLIGSHNLTVGGARTNAEAGVLFMSAGPSTVTAVTGACANHIANLASNAARCFDSLDYSFTQHS